METARCATAQGTGVLIEKAKTTPAAYPMTVNAIVTGCNQKNNRDPSPRTTTSMWKKRSTKLRSLGAVSELDWLGRVSKYKHHAYEWLGVSKPEIAVMTELLLRGAQALGELRGRAARLEPIADLTALKPIVDALVARGSSSSSRPWPWSDRRPQSLHAAGALGAQVSSQGAHADGRGS